MYSIYHLTSHTRYGITIGKDNRFHICYFKKYRDALHVGNSIATYRYIHKKKPQDDKLCICYKKSILKDALNEDLWIDKLDYSDIYELKDEYSKYNMDIMLIKNIEIKNDDEEIYIDAERISTSSNSLLDTHFIKKLEELYFYNDEDDT